MSLFVPGIVLLSAVPVAVWDFAVSSHDLLHYGAPGQWEHGVPTTGPGGAHAVWATRLHGPYLNESLDHLELQLPDVSHLTRPSLVVRHWYAFGPGDAGRIEVLTSGDWQVVEPTYGYPSGSGFAGTSTWTDTTVPLAGLGSSPRLRFTFASDHWIADAGWYLARVELYDGDVTQPWVSPLAWPSDTQDLEGPYVVRAKVVDDVALESVRLVWTTVDGGGDVPMHPLGGDLFEGGIPAQPPGTQVQWHVEARDQAGNVARSAASPPSFRVFLAAPRELGARWSGRAVGQAVELTWGPPHTPHEVLGYVVHDVGGEVEPFVTSGPPTLLDLRPGDPDAWQVSAIYAAGVGDPSNTLILDVERPSLTRLEPAVAVQGETLHLRLEGASLYLLDGHSALDLGAGVRVIELDVLDVDRLAAWIEIEPDAAPGLRDAVVRGVQGSATFREVFEVRDAATALHAISVTPPRLRQGQSVDVEIELSGPIGEELTVHADDALLVHGAPSVRSHRVLLPLAVGRSAAPGRYVIVLDDGASRVSVDLEVEERTVGAVQRACRHGAPAGPAGLLAWVALAACRRRRR